MRRMLAFAFAFSLFPALATADGCPFWPKHREVDVPASGFVVLGWNATPSTCDHDTLGRWVKESGPDHDLFLHLDGPHGSHRDWTIHVGIGPTGSEAPQRGVSFESSTVAWGTSADFRGVRLPWLEDVDGDGRVEVIVWDSVSVLSGDDETPPQFPAALVGWAYEITTDARLVSDWPATRRTMVDISDVYRRTARSPDARHSYGYAARFARRLDEFSRGRCCPGHAEVFRSASDYAVAVSDVDERRAELAEVERDEATFEKAGTLLCKSIVDRLAPFWYGTPWSYSGTTQVPGEGTIACGYFVTTLLRDAGFDIPRVRWAQEASETMIRALVAPHQVRRFSQVPFEDFLAAVEEWGTGLYLVGLDNHVAFLAVDARGVRMLHSSFVAPTCAVDEDAATSSVLANSRYRVVGKLTEDRQLLAAWLDGVAVAD